MVYINVFHIHTLAIHSWPFHHIFADFSKLSVLENIYIGYIYVRGSVCAQPYVYLVKALALILGVTKLILTIILSDLRG